MLAFFAVMVFMAFPFSQVCAQTNHDAEIDSLMRAAFKPDAPGAAVLVAKDGKVIFPQGLWYG